MDNPLIEDAMKISVEDNSLSTHVRDMIRELVYEVERLTRFAKLVDEQGIMICVPENHPDHPDNRRYYVWQGQDAENRK